MSDDKLIARMREMEAKLRDIGRLIGQGIDKADGWGFCLMMFDFGPSGAMSYISNAQRADMIRMLHEFLANLQRGDRGLLDGKPQTVLERPLGDA